MSPPSARPWPAADRAKAKLDAAAEAGVATLRARLAERRGRPT